MRMLHVIFLASFWAVVCQSGQSALAETTQEKLAEVVRKAIEDKTVAVEEPGIVVRGGKLSYRTLGGLKRPLNQFEQDADEKYQGHWYPAKPLEVPLDLQFRIEVLRNFIKKDNKTFKEEHLTELGKVVARELALIDKHRGSQEKLLEELAVIDRQAYLVLIGALEARARREKLTFAGPISDAPRNFTVRFEGVPREGKVGYLTFAAYQIHQEQDTLKKMDSWWSAQESEDLTYGVYMFCAFLPGDKTQTKKVLVDKDKTVSFAGP